MARPGCHLTNCPFQPIPASARVAIALAVSAVVLFKQLLDGLGIAYTDVIANTHLNVKFSLLGPLAALALSGFYAYHHVTEKNHIFFFLFDMMSLPSLMLAVIAIKSGTF